MKKVVYTVLTGCQEIINDPFSTLPNTGESPLDYERICFTDNPDLKSSVWECRLLDGYALQAFIECRRPKLLPHLFLEEYDISLYIDNTVQLLVSPTLIFEKYSTNKSPLTCFKHPWRDCIYDEGEEVIRQEIDKEETVRSQLDFYEAQSFPKNLGLIAGTVLLRRHNDPDLIRVSEEWMAHVLNFSKRDQLSFNFVAWHHNFKPDFFEGSLVENSIIQWPNIPGEIRVPPNFDSSVYRWLNPQVDLSGLSAQQHYLKQGHKQNLRYALYRSELNRIANKYKTDKGNLYYNGHGYAEVYERYLSALRNRPFTLLEIGLLRHDVQAKENTSIYSDVPSLKMWHEYFPKAKIYGFDIADFSGAPPLENVKILKGDMGSQADLEALVNIIDTGIDVIIEDASHASHHQQKALGYLFQFLNPGGLYFIEDLHYQPSSLEVKGIPKTQTVLKNLQIGKFLATDFITQDSLSYIHDNLDFMAFYDSLERKLGGLHQDALAVLHKSPMSLSKDKGPAQTQITSSTSNLATQKYSHQFGNKRLSATSDLLKIDLGCGPSKARGFVGVDIAPGPGVDIIADLSQVFPFEDSSVDELRAHDVIEHLADRIHTMNEIWRVCKPGAKVDIRVPSSDGRGAFQDPTHISFWNINSFQYYCIEFPAYLQLCHQYGFKGAFKVLNLAHEQSAENVIHVNALLEVVKPVSQGLSTSVRLSQPHHSPTIDSRPTPAQSSVTSAQSQEEIASNTSRNLATYLQKYKQDPGDRAVLANLRRERHKFSNECLSLSPKELELAHSKTIHHYHQLFFKSNFQRESLTPTETVLVNDQLRNLTEVSDGHKYVQAFLILSLYCRLDQIPLPVNIESLPTWFLPSYVQLILTSPPHSEKLGDSDRYYTHFSQFFQALHQAAFQNKTLPDSIIVQIAKSTTFIPLYFNESNLKALYTQRSDFLEAALEIQGHTLDHEFSPRSTGSQKIRLGILASHFDHSAETSSSLTIYEYISREFEVTLYTLRQPTSEIGHYCCRCANDLKVLPQDLADQVEFIRSDDLDILFIGTNVTAVSNSIALLALHRLARIQLTSVTSIATTGFRHMDYYLSGELTDPSSNAQLHYRETLLQVPGSIHCFSYGTELSKASISVTREDLGIADESIVYGVAANFFKCIPELLHTWANIIAAIPNSVLMLLPFGPNWSQHYPKQTFIRQTHAIFAEHGVVSDRILIIDPQPVPNREEVKEYLALADIYLDSYPVGGTTSLMEPLDLGLPIVSRKGEFLRGAMGAAILEAMQLTEWVTASESTYIQLATELGTDSDLRDRFRHQVQQQMQTNPPVLNSQKFGHMVGNLFKELIRDYHAQELDNRFNLRSINVLIFPNWKAPEEDLLESIAEVIDAIAHHPRSDSITLLLDGTGVDEEDANLALSSVAMNLMMMAEDADVYETLELSFIDSLPPWQWKALLPQIKGRIVLPMENMAAVTHASATSLPQVHLNNLNEL